MAILKQIRLNPAFIISAITLLIGVVSQVILPPEIPLFYGLPQTAEQLSPSIMIVIPAIISMVISILNSILANKITDSYLKKILSFTAISVSILASITTLKIIFLIGSI